MKEGLNTTKSKQLFSRAQHFIPGGVNSPVRAFRAVGGDPLFIRSAKGAYLFDEDGNRYIDLFNSWGPMILGHAHDEIEAAVKAAIPNSLSFGAPTKAEVEMAELIVSMMNSVDKVRLVNSGTEATMSAIRLARGYTGKDKVIKFEGCYHGHGDSFLIAAGSGVATMGIPDSPGVTKGTALDTLTAPFNDLQAVQYLLEENRDTIAAIIVEPVAGNMGCIPPKPGFLEGLRKLCDKHGMVLIFDEVMTGFRLGTEGAQGIYEVYPDLTTLGKIIGGGLPVGAYGGKKEIMEFVSPTGPVYQAGTLSGNPVAVAAGKTMLAYLKDHPDVYEKVAANGEKLASGWKDISSRYGKAFTINQVGSMVSLFFAEKPVCNFQEAKRSDTELFANFFRYLLYHGIYLPPSQFESLFLSAALGEDDLEHVLEVTDKFFSAQFQS